MSIPKYFEFMKPLLSMMSDKKEHSRKEIYSSMAERFKLTDEEMKEWLPSGNQLIYKNRIGWAITYLKKAGLLESSKRSTYKITSQGIDVLKDGPEIIDSKYLQKFKGFQEFQGSGNKSNNEDDITSIASNEESPQDQLEDAYQTILSALMDDVLNEVMNQSPDFFEKLVVDLLVSMGYGGRKIKNGQVLGKSGDGGIDGVIKEDKLGFEKIYIQAKRWDVSSTVGRPEIQRFVGALSGNGAQKGAFITTAKFSKEAKEYAGMQYAYKIALIDGENLAKLMIENNIGVSVVDTYVIKQIDTDYFNQDEV
ncbi:restriction endonuclease [Gudongella sp. SC589]|uniref:restriction endonuclease n=1 Tax=Gudongella sp. SC589 TaxID=3385990 RepID=UPI0039048FB2